MHVSKCVPRKALLAVLWSLAGAAGCVNCHSRDCQGVSLQWVRQTLSHCGSCHTSTGWQRRKGSALFQEFMHFLQTGGLSKHKQTHQRSQKPPAEQKELAKTPGCELTRSRSIWRPVWLRPTRTWAASRGFARLWDLASPWMPQTFWRCHSCSWPHQHPWQCWYPTLQETEATSKS